MRIRANKSFFESRVQPGSQKVSQAKSSRAWSTPQSNSTEAVQTASNQECHGLASSKSRKSRNRNRNKNRANGRAENTVADIGHESSKYSTTAPAVGLKYTSDAGVTGSNKYDTDTPVPGLKYRNEQSESVRLIVRSNNLGALKARIVIQLGDSSLGHNVSTERTTVKSEAELLTKSAASNKSNYKNWRGPNSQHVLKSNFRNWNKPFGGNNNKNKGYRSPNSGNKNSIPTRRYSPFTEEQKRKFSRLLKETLVSDC